MKNNIKHIKNRNNATVYPLHVGIKGLHLGYGRDKRYYTPSQEHITWDTEQINETNYKKKFTNMHDLMRWIRLEEYFCWNPNRKATKLNHPDLFSTIYKKSGIYKITNKVTKKIYIGKSKNLLVRLNSYFNEEYIKSKRSSKLCKAFLKFGYDKFSFTVLEHCDIDLLSRREQLYINHLKPQYNIRKSVHKSITQK
jgi:hypothetical protein